MDQIHQEECEQTACVSSPYSVDNLFKNKKNESQCPLSRETLGFFSWSLLHTIAIHYPIQPSESQKIKIKNLIEGFAEFYPCKFCRAHFQHDIQDSPPQVESQTELSQWLCYQHNKTNLLLGKPEFDCSMESLKKRWLYNPSCKERDY